MEEENAVPAPSSPAKAWRDYVSEDLPRTVQESADSAIRSARSFQRCSSIHLRSFQDFVPQFSAQYRNYEEAFFHKVKGELESLREHPAMAGGVAVSACLLLMRSPRRFLFRQTLGRFRSEEAQFVRSEKNMNEFTMSVDLMKKESKKLLERSALAGKDMNRGYFDLKNSGNQIQSLARSAYKTEAEAADLMDLLREIPGREALKLRADVASMSSHLRQQRLNLDKRTLKISELGVPV